MTEAEKWRRHAEQVTALLVASIAICGAVAGTQGIGDKDLESLCRGIEELASRVPAELVPHFERVMTEMDVAKVIGRRE